MRCRRRHAHDQPILPRPGGQPGPGGIGRSGSMGQTGPISPNGIDKSYLTTDASYVGVNGLKNGSNGRLLNSAAVPFRDYDSSSSDEELFRKPYSDTVS